MIPYFDCDGLVIYCGDCRDILPSLEAGSVDLVLTDPPYGIGFDYGDGHDDNADGYPEFIWSVVEASESLCKPGGSVVCFQSSTNARSWTEWFPRDWRLIALPKTFVQMRPTILQWSTDYALFWHVGGKPTNAFRDWQSGVSRDWFVSTLANVPRSPLLKQHPCPRPLDLIAYLVGNLCPPKGVVLDPFMGSGTTLRAAKNLGRRAIGIEIEERYCEIAVKRLQQSVMHLDVA